MHKIKEIGIMSLAKLLGVVYACFGVLAGLFIGITIGLHYGGTLSAFMPVFLVLGILYLLRFISAHR